MDLQKYILRTETDPEIGASTKGRKLVIGRPKNLNSVKKKMITYKLLIILKN